MIRSSQFATEVERKYQLYNGLFLSLPFENVRSAGIMLPVFASYCAQQLARGSRPARIVAGFLADRVPELDEKERADFLFGFLQLAERQVVLFDALEDAAFSRLHPLDGPGTLREFELVPKLLKQRCSGQPHCRPVHLSDPKSLRQEVRR